MRELPDPYILAFLLALAAVVLLSYRRVVSAVRGAAACVRGQHGTQEMLGNNAVFGAVRYSFGRMLPFYAMMVIALLIVTFCPHLVMFLPNIMMPIG